MANHGPNSSYVQPWVSISILTIGIQSHSYTTSPDSKTLYHTLLSPTTFSSTLANNNAVTVNAQTGYPFSSTITYQISAQQAFSFGIRVPTWVSNRQISYSIDGGASQTGTANGAGYVVLSVATGSHTVTANIPMTIRTEHRFNNAVTVYRGQNKFKCSSGNHTHGLIIRTFDIFFGYIVQHNRAEHLCGKSWFIIFRHLLTLENSSTRKT
jgi:hypothetical protein